MSLKSSTFWNEVYTILVQDAGASERERDTFLHHCNDFTEWRFCGNLGFGGKLWRSNWKNGQPYINCYEENENKKTLKIINKVNGKLQILYNDCFTTKLKKLLDESNRSGKMRYNVFNSKLKCSHVDGPAAGIQVDLNESDRELLAYLGNHAEEILTYLRQS